MSSIVLGCAYIFGHHLKAGLRNENKKIINFVTICRNNSFVASVRNVMSMSEEEDSDTQNIESAKFDIKKYNCIKKNELVDIINQIDSTNFIGSSEALLLLQSCGNVTDCLPLDKVELGESLWTILTICNFKLNTAHYNALLKLYVENEYDFSPSQLLKIMKDNKIYANSITYKMCIEYYCMKGNIKKALRFLKDMERLRFPISESIFNSILLGYSLFGCMQDINKTLASMKQKKLQLTTGTYTAIMCAYAKVNNIDQIRNILETCNSQNVYFTNTDILNIIYILVKNNRNAQIDTMYQYLNKKKQITYNEIQVILKLLSINQIDVAISSLSYMSLSSDHPQYEDILKLILEYMINKGSLIRDIVYLITFFKSEATVKKSLLILLYHSLIKNDHLSLQLLQLCKRHCVIKPHYFWPLLISHGSKYNLQGILEILDIMINDFNIVPCVDTIVNYVLPLIFGDMIYVRNLLLKHNLNETILNNAYIISYLRRGKLKEAVAYVRYFRGKYFYKILAHDLRQTSVVANNIQGFIYISCNLLEDMDLCSTLKEKNESCNIALVPIDKQLLDFMIDFPYRKSWLTKVICEIANQNIKLKSETIEIIRKFLHGYATNNVISRLQNLSNKEA